MDLQKFIDQRPYLYHLTSEVNATNIIATKRLLSANQLITMAGVADIDTIKRTKRTQHLNLTVDGKEILLRDQRPISEKALSKCLTNGWAVGDFLYHLNERIFMWPTLDRLWKHFNRYENEKPVIFRFTTKDILEANHNVKFSRLNSGATRANSHLGGKAPERGLNTFLNAEQFILPLREVAEVTFENYCVIKGDMEYSYRPDSNYTIVP
jgi:hypothetical protein